MLEHLVEIQSQEVGVRQSLPANELSALVDVGRSTQDHHEDQVLAGRRVARSRIQRDKVEEAGDVLLAEN